jgi:hypothetical protein
MLKGGSMHSTVQQSVAITNFFWVAEFVLSIALLSITRARKLPLFFWLRCFLWLKCVSFPVLFTIVTYKPFGDTLAQQYNIYFYTYWSFYALESFICFMVLRELFLVSLEPLEGLRRLGLVLFTWIATISAVVALAVSFAPSETGAHPLIQAVGEFQRCQSVLQMCLLVFLVMVARPLGVNLNNRIFGASLGFSLLAFSDLCLSGVFHSQTMVSTLNIFHAAALTISLCIWIGYAFLPEPKRVPVSLPVTSALLRWNEVARSLGKSGGRVVVVGNQEIIDHDIAAWDKAVAVVRSKHPLAE